MLAGFGGKQSAVVGLWLLLCRMNGMLLRLILRLLILRKSLPFSLFVALFISATRKYLVVAGLSLCPIIEMEK